MKPGEIAQHFLIDAALRRSLLINVAENLCNNDLGLVMKTVSSTWRVAYGNCAYIIVISMYSYFNLKFYLILMVMLLMNIGACSM